MAISPLPYQGARAETTGGYMPATCEHARIIDILVVGHHGPNFLSGAFGHVKPKLSSQFTVAQPLELSQEQDA